MALAGKLNSVELALAMAATMIHVELAVTHGDACRSAGGRAAVTNALGQETLVPHHNLFLERDATCRRNVFAGRGGRGLCTVPVSLGAFDKLTNVKCQLTKVKSQMSNVKCRISIVNEMKCPRDVAECLRVANDPVTNTLPELLHNVTGCLP